MERGCRDTIFSCRRGWVQTHPHAIRRSSARDSHRMATLRYFYKITFEKSSGFRHSEAKIGHFECFSCQFCARMMIILIPFSPREGLPALSKHKISRVSDSRFRAKKRSATSRKAPARSQRARRQVATAAPLQCNKGPVAEPGGRHGSPDPALSKRDRGQHDCKHLYNNVLQKQ